MQDIQFLSLEDLIGLHEYQIDHYVGLHGIRDLGLLESATYEPQASFGGQYLHKNIFEMAAAYAYSIIKNHPFLDGNKRTGIDAALTFLVANNYELNASINELEKLAIGIATSKITREQVAAFFAKKVSYN